MSELLVALPHLPGNVVAVSEAATVAPGFVLELGAAGGLVSWTAARVGT